MSSPIFVEQIEPLSSHIDSKYYILSATSGECIYLHRRVVYKLLATLHLQYRSKFKDHRKRNVRINDLLDYIARGHDGRDYLNSEEV